MSTSITELLDQDVTNHVSMVNMMTQLTTLMPTSKLLTTNLPAPSIRTFVPEVCWCADKENSFVHVSWPVWADLKVAALPIKMSALRARDSRTLRRGDYDVAFLALVVVCAIWIFGLCGEAPEKLFVVIEFVVVAISSSAEGSSDICADARGLATSVVEDGVPFTLSAEVPFTSGLPSINPFFSMFLMSKSLKTVSTSLPNTSCNFFNCPRYGVNTTILLALYFCCNRYLTVLNVISASKVFRLDVLTLTVVGSSEAASSVWAVLCFWSINEVGVGELSDQIRDPGSHAMLLGKDLMRLTNGLYFLFSGKTPGSLPLIHRCMPFGSRLISKAWLYLGSPFIAKVFKAPNNLRILHTDFANILTTNEAACEESRTTDLSNFMISCISVVVCKRPRTGSHWFSICNYKSKSSILHEVKVVFDESFALLWVKVFEFGCIAARNSSQLHIELCDTAKTFDFFPKSDLYLFFDFFKPILPVEPEQICQIYVYREDNNILEVLKVVVMLWLKDISTSSRIGSLMQCMHSLNPLAKVTGSLAIIRSYGRTLRVLSWILEPGHYGLKDYINIFWRVVDVESIMKTLEAALTGQYFLNHANRVIFLIQGHRENVWVSKGMSPQLSNCLKFRVESELQVCGTAALGFIVTHEFANL
ncbi:hypothetical protein KCU99_g279, partial [Aureobasidium melanogenum]